MQVNWIMNPVTGTLSADVDGRNINIERVKSSFEIWYGSTGRRIRVGVCDVLSDAKVIAEDLLERLISVNSFLEHHHD